MSLTASLTTHAHTDDIFFDRYSRHRRRLC